MKLHFFFFLVFQTSSLVPTILKTTLDTKIYVIYDAKVVFAISVLHL